MANKVVKLEGFGSIILLPINFKEQDYEEVTSTGEKLIKQVVGEGRKTIYKTEAGVEIPARQVCRKYKVGNEEVITPKLEVTKEVAQQDIEVIEDNGEIYTAIDKKVYFVTTESPKLKELIHSGKSLKFPFVAGLGFKFYSAILTRWQDKIILCCCRGNLNDALSVYSDDLVEFNYEVAPPKETLKKLMTIKARY